MNSVVQCKPPAGITAINVQAQWGLLGFGTSHGYALFDYQQVIKLAHSSVAVFILANLILNLKSYGNLWKRDTIELLLKSIGCFYRFIAIVCHSVSEILRGDHFDDFVLHGPD